jgi:apolipoprotein N-acyltransferase
MKLRLPIPALFLFLDPFPEIGTKSLVLKTSRLVALTLLTGLLLIAAWPLSPLTPLIFIAWTPLLGIANSSIKKNKFFGYTFLSLLLWNTGTTWWIWNSTDVGTIAAIITNTLFMCLPWWGYFIFKNWHGRCMGYASLVCFWMLFEYIHFNWQLSWPWLTLGNAFASHPAWVQWYEYTGVAGGTFWVLTVNILLFECFRALQHKQRLTRLMLLVASLLLLPVCLSLLLYPGSETKEKITSPGNVVIIQPNIDPYGKFNEAGASVQIAKLVQLSEQAIDTATQLVLWPETAMSAGDWQDHVTMNQYYQPVFALAARHPRLTILSGIETYKNYGLTQSTLTARKANDGTYYDAFNAAVVIKDAQPLQFYNKSKLVPGVESMPSFLNFMAPLFEKFGGTTGGYGRSETSAAFQVKGNPYITAPIICYESVYGEYVGSYVQKGANLLTIMTNDGWWGNTPGHKQHLQYARLRAIETRRWVARSANTGISAVIDPAGNIHETRPWNQAAAIKYNIPAGSAMTFYVRYGDYIYKTISLFALLFLAWHLWLWTKRKWMK